MAMKPSNEAQYLVRVFGKDVGNPNNVRNFNCPNQGAAAKTVLDQTKRDDVHKVQMFVLVGEWVNDRG